jgi:hypothetical protein
MFTVNFTSAGDRFGRSGTKARARAKKPSSDY